MNDLIKRLNDLTKRLNHKGWFSIVPSGSNEIVLRVEWYLDDKYGWEQRFSLQDLELARFDILDIFIEQANYFIDEKIGNKYS